ncbi:MAG: penicillin-binding protein 2, partial [Candidatus Marinimicrobia bacterium]|nr:penicillin-binding protein 2 [Candidatus Neomarinimicrobiota bacterium]
MYYIQIVQYSRFVGIAEANRIRIVPLEAQRGIIYDRNGQIIADNKSQYNINIIPFEVRSSEKTYNILGDFLGLTKNQIQRR